VTEQFGISGLLGGGRGNIGTGNRVVGISAFIGVDALFDPPTIAIWLELGAYIQVGGSGHGLRPESKGGFIITKDDAVSAGFQWDALEYRVLLWFSSQYVLRKLYRGGGHLGAVIRFVQTHVRGVELSLKKGLRVDVRAELGSVAPEARRKSFRIGFEIRWYVIAFQGSVAGYPWNWSEEQWNEILERAAAWSPF
jgi:hypothetical protein